MKSKKNPFFRKKEAILKRFLRKAFIKYKKLSLFIHIMFFSFLILWFTGKTLDRQAEEYIDGLYNRDLEGIIKGLEPRENVHGHENAIVILHSFLSSPQQFSDLYVHLNKDKRFDTYIPLLPFHGKSLKSASQFDNEKILKFVANYIKEIENKYENIVLMGFSYGGALLIELEKRHTLPQNAKLILYSPSLFIKGNDFLGNIVLQLYGMWRNYCDYQLLGCGYPVYDSGDKAARYNLENESNLQYKVISATKQLYELDRKNRDYMQHINLPHDLIFANDDNRIDIETQKKICSINQARCTLHAFPSGKHMLHWSVHKKDFESLVESLLKKRTHKNA